MLGQTIGKVEDNLSVTNNAGDTVKIRAFYDYSGMLDTDVKTCLVGSGTRIAFQRVLRPMSKDEIKALDGTTIDACNAGKKVKSDEQIKAEYKTRFDASSPEAKQQMIDELQAAMNEIDVKDETIEDDDLE